MATVSEIESRIAALESDLAAARRELHEATIAESSVRIGDIYRCVRRRYKKPDIIERGQVTGFRRQRFSHKTVAVITLFKKDGSLGKRETELSQRSGWVSEPMRALETT